MLASAATQVSEKITRPAAVRHRARDPAARRRSAPGHASVKPRRIA